MNTDPSSQAHPSLETAIFLYQQGRFSEALELFYLLAEDHAEAQCWLGLLFFRGEGVTANSIQAAEFFAKAAERNSANGCYYYGTLFMQGDGVPRDPAKASYWLTQAERLGHADAAKVLQQIWTNHQEKSPKGHFDQTLEDLRALSPQLLLPIEELKSMRWLQDKQFLSLAALGLLPLVFIAAFSNNVGAIYWGIAFYSSALWALFLHRLLATPEVETKKAVGCFFGTGIVAIAILMTVFQLLGSTSLLATIVEWANSPKLIPALFGHFFQAALPEEMIKALVLIVILRTSTTRPSAQTMLFYGMMSGLGFGIYEGVGYQMGRNMESGVVGGYFLNMIRLTSLPFLHAMWTGICGYFLAFAWHSNQRGKGLYAAAILIPVFLHTLHNGLAAAGLSYAMLAVDFLSVLALMVYRSRSQEIEKASL